MGIHTKQMAVFQKQKKKLRQTILYNLEVNEEAVAECAELKLSITPKSVGMTINRYKK